MRCLRFGFTPIHDAGRKAGARTASSSHRGTCDRIVAVTRQDLRGERCPRRIGRKNRGGNIRVTRSAMSELLHGDITDGILGGFYAVGRQMGHGFLESVYQAAMFLELTDRAIKVRANIRLPVRFKGRIVGDFKADLIVEDKVIVEVKAMRVIEPSSEAQLLNYLRASDVEVGLI